MPTPAVPSGNKAEPLPIIFHPCERKCGLKEEKIPEPTPEKIEKPCPEPRYPPCKKDANWKPK